MDSETARAALPSLTRAVFGEFCTITPMVRGRLKNGPDPDRSVITDVMGRFDFDPEQAVLGGGRSSGDRVEVGGESATVSFDRDALAWEPISGDQVSRVYRGAAEIYEIVRPARDGGNVVIFFLSRVD